MPTGLTEEQRYLFDTQGFLVLEDALTPDEVDELNGLLDEYDLWTNQGAARFANTWSNDPNFVTVGSIHLWDAPFRRLIDHPAMLPYMTEICGPGLRYDHGQALLMRPGGKHLALHGGGTPYEPDQHYLVRDGKMHNGLVAVSYALTETLPGMGGFAAIPGSHKANFACPKRILSFEETGPWVVQVSARPGSAIIFTEALTHGTWPWTADYERRAMLVKYCPGHMAWTANTADARHIALPDGEQYTARQRLLLTHPYAASRADVAPAVN